MTVKTHQIALKVDVDTLRGTREGVPVLLDLLKKHGARATFLFSLGPDHTGRAIRRVFRKGFFSKVRRTSVVSNYGFPTLLYGTLLPGPDIGKSAPEIMRRTKDEGFETGIHAWDHVGWQDGVQGASAAWTRAEMQRAQNRYTDVFKEPAQTHGAAGWQMSTSALRQTQDLGFEYCSDGRTQAKATFAHYPVIQGEIIGCAQLPTNLPTLDELIGIDGCTEANVDQALLARTAPGKHPVDSNGAHCHVFTLHAELEGGRLMPIFERLLSGWRNQGYELVTTRALFRSLSTGAIPYHHVGLRTIPGRSGSLLVAGARYTAAA